MIKNASNSDGAVRPAWVDPEITELEFNETNSFPGRGADVGGNPAIDCQRS